MPTNEPIGQAAPTAEQLAAGGWRELPEDDDDGLAGELDDRGLIEGARLTVSRDCTAEDLEAIMPDKSADEREAFLTDLRDKGCDITFAVSTIVPGGELAGYIMGTPGFERFLRRPDSAAADVERAGGEVVDEVDRREGKWSDVMTVATEEANGGTIAKIGAYEVAERRLFELFGTVDPEQIRTAGGDATYVGAAVNLAAARRDGAGGGGA